MVVAICKFTDPRSISSKSNLTTMSGKDESCVIKRNHVCWIAAESVAILFLSAVLMIVHVLSAVANLASFFKWPPLKQGWSLVSERWAGGSDRGFLCQFFPECDGWTDGSVKSVKSHERDLDFCPYSVSDGISPNRIRLLARIADHLSTQVDRKNSATGYHRVNVMRRDLKKIRGCAPRPNVMGMVGVWKFNEACSQMSLSRVMFSECMSLFLTHIPYAPLSFPHHSRFPHQSSWIYPRREFSRLQRSRRFQYRSSAGAVNQMK